MLSKVSICGRNHWLPAKRLASGFVLLGAFFASCNGSAEPPAAPVQFNRDIRPILSDKCFSCHGIGSEDPAADLRLDQFEAATESAIVPGDVEASEVVARIESDDPDSIMPPPDSHKELSPEEIKLIRQWIQQGAGYEDHWAYQPMRRASSVDAKLPLSKQIDQITASRFEQAGMKPAGPADPVTLIRRLSFDLTGLPPTLDQVKAFQAKHDRQAIEALVDQYLASPAYGERMAMYWLDLVRYADTVGYHGDQNVSQSPYRDYVIQSFHRNMRYDQFVREQLAGDLLPDATLQQKVASGYNRLNQTTEEGGSQAKEYLAIYFADRVRNVSQVFLGSTMGCAQCHDHKYDPFTAKDFYSFGAFFADLQEVGVYSNRGRPPMMRVPTAEQQQQIKGLEQQIADAEAKQPGLRAELLTKLAAWEGEAAKQIGVAVEVEKPWVDDALLVQAPTNGDWRFIAGDEKAGIPVHSGTKVRRQQSGELVQHYFDRSKQPLTVTDDTVFYSWVYIDPKNPAKALMLQINNGDWSHRKVWGSDDIVFGRTDKSGPAYFRAGALPATGQWTRLTVSAKEVGLKSGDKVSGMAFTQFAGKVFWDDAGYVDTDGVPAAIAKTLQTPKEKRDDTQQQNLITYYLESQDAWKDWKQQVQTLKDQRQRVEAMAPQTVVSVSGKARPIRILPRGNWLDESGPIVQPAVPEFMGQLEVGSERASRLDLADWICQPDNPLTARTMVNRVWALLFGRGIYTSLDDMGGQGTYPSDVELLDTLALEFIESGWDVKQLVREIVLTDAYQRSSLASAEWLQADAFNDKFARQGRFPLMAEMVRDNALQISGLLVDQVGGGSVRPYQPAGYYAQLNFPRRKYQADQGGNQYRRGVYTHWQRTFLHPMLKAFDAPSREECTAARARSNTPLQALVLLNDPTFIEAARVYAQRIMKHTPQQDDRMVWAFENAVSRQPSDEIKQTLKDVYQAHLAHYRDHPEAVAELLPQGQQPVDESLNAAELAAWTGVARVILNLHELTTRY